MSWHLSVSIPASWTLHVVTPSRGERRRCEAQTGLVAVTPINELCFAVPDSTGSGRPRRPVKTCSRLLGLQPLACDFGRTLLAQVLVHSPVQGKSFSSEVSAKSATCSGALGTGRCPGHANHDTQGLGQGKAADVGAKHLAAPVMHESRETQAPK